MRLSTRCYHAFPPAIADRGGRYARRHRVSIEHCAGGSLFARVRGSRGERYAVEIHLVDEGGLPRVLVTCTCPHYRRRNLCKHVWACLLEADVRGMGAEVPGENRIDVVPFDELDTDDGGSLVVRRRRFRGGFGDLEDEDADLDFDDVDLAEQSGARRTARPAGKQDWRKRLALIGMEAIRRDADGPTGRAAWRRREAWFLVVAGEPAVDDLEIQFFQREMRRNGAWGRVKALKVDPDDLTRFSSEDREILETLVGSRPYFDGPGVSRHGPLISRRGPAISMCVVPPALYSFLVPRLCNTGRIRLVNDEDQELDEFPPLRWDEGEPWRFELTVSHSTGATGWRLAGGFVRGDERLPLEDADLVVRGGLLVAGGALSRFAASPHDARWAAELRRSPPITIPEKQLDELVGRLWKLPHLPRVNLPASHALEQVRVTPTPALAFRLPAAGAGGPAIRAKMYFLYGPRRVDDPAQGAGFLEGGRRVFLRDPDKEGEAVGRLAELGFEPDLESPELPWTFSISQAAFSRAVRELLKEEWTLQAEGFAIRSPSGFAMTVTSGVDWFNLQGDVTYDDFHVGLPELLAAVKKGETFVRLGDGTRGILPEEWLARYGRLAEMADGGGDGLRFARSQAMLLDALLATAERVDIDSVFDGLRKRLGDLDGVGPVQPHPRFTGRLRAYQSLGVGWMEFLRECGLGGILADDMGLGKTVQTLALLQKHYAEGPSPRGEGDGPRRRPSIIVVPKSLVHNWLEEAKRFTPDLNVLCYAGADRGELRDALDASDVVVTTYGTLRRDITALRDVDFDYAILDEAQAIKNFAAQTSKASRLLRARHRLALTGTPVENHLGELFSIFEFLNPGMMGKLPQRSVHPRREGLFPSNEWLEVLTRSLRPFILRRTKEQVLTELPEKTEQTLYCEMGPTQRRLYEELRCHYEALLAERIASQGLNKSKIHVLEALLRLRQTACHPGLLDPSRAKHGSAKVDVLLDHLEEVISEGHKSLVFSQFTSLLALVRRRLDERGVAYEYLDGKTRKRAEVIHRFQNDPGCPLFLISLKAGGHGLNLTAANYVFLLDPWWNPAVEAQAVDRTHRIGQRRPVFAYRLICAGTIEEKILELQGAKRRLADAVTGADESFLKSLSAEDLRYLLS